MMNRRTVSALAVLVGLFVWGQPGLAAAHDGVARGRIALEAGDVVPPSVFAWRVASGSWEGVALDGLTVAAIVPGRSPAHGAETGAVITVDLRATALQRAALVSLARELSGGRISDIAHVRPSVVRFGADSRYVVVRAEDLLRLTTLRPAMDPEGQAP